LNCDTLCEKYALVSHYELTLLIIDAPITRSYAIY